MPNFCGTETEMASSNVIAFAVKDRARDRKRSIALTAIVPRMHDLIDKGEDRKTADGKPMRQTWHNGICLTFAPTTSEGIFFSVYDPQIYKDLISGFLNPPKPGRYLSGAVEILTWGRGWESRLF
jgi:hypothetical protein